MKEEDFKKQYAGELNQMHAPAELISMTKKKAAAEQKKYAVEKKRKRIYRYLSAAAALLVISVSAVFFTVFESTGTQENTKKYLGSHEEGTGPGTEEQVVIERLGILPMEFKKDTAWEEEIGSVRVCLAVTSQGTYMAAFEEEDVYVIVKSQVTDKKEFREILERILMK